MSSNYQSSDAKTYFFNFNPQTTLAKNVITMPFQSNARLTAARLENAWTTKICATDTSTVTIKATNGRRSVRKFLTCRENAARRSSAARMVNVSIRQSSATTSTIAATRVTNRVSALASAISGQRIQASFATARGTAGIAPTRIQIIVDLTARRELSSVAGKNVKKL